jgi:L-ascorbate metabolism protein UlaG (beta-lactamase superfamily)
MIIFLVILFTLVAGIWLFMHQPKFGKLPTGERLEAINNSINYRNNQFQNIHHTPALAEGESYARLLKKYFFADRSNTVPKQPIPTVKTNLFEIGIDKNVLVWFGHSSYYMQVDGKRILVDPVFSPSISPIPGGTKAFKGTDIYKPADIPAIDYLFLTHDHWDHLDYKTVLALKPKVGKIICALGIGAHLERWGFAKNEFIETDWNEFIQLDNGFTINTTPARHFSGRTFKRNKAIWISCVFTTPNHNIFIGGDSGYDTHFAEIGNKFGPFDIAILENGQYNKSWKYIHMMPEEVIQAAADLQAKKLLPVHSSKFSLSLHDWDEPLKTIISLPNETGVNIITPKIGEVVEIDNQQQSFTHWWQHIS